MGCNLCAPCHPPYRATTPPAPPGTRCQAERTWTRECLQKFAEGAGAPVSCITAVTQSWQKHLENKGLFGVTIHCGGQVDRESRRLLSQCGHTQEAEVEVQFTLSLLFLQDPSCPYAGRVFLPQSTSPDNPSWACPVSMVILNPIKATGKISQSS